MIRYENAVVFTGDLTFAEAFVVDGSRFVFVGTQEEAKARFPHAESCDLQGQFVCPGFNDSHMHLFNLGCSLMQAQLGQHSLRDMLRALGDYAAAHPESAFITGRGFNQDHFIDERRMPTRKDLDAVCPDKPCLIRRVCGHVAVANSAALVLAGISETAVPVDGGEIVTDETGRPTGLLCENAIGIVASRIPRPDREEIKRCICAGMERALSYGITSVQSDDFTTEDVPFEEIMAAYLELKAENRMKIRVTQQCNLPTLEDLNRFLNAGYLTGWGDALFRVGPLKLLADGSLGARTAYLLAPYDDDPSSCGIATYSQKALTALITHAHCAGMQIAVHVIGDGGCDMVLKAFEAAQKALSRENARHGLVHAQITNRSQLRRMGALGLHAYIQSIFLDYDTMIVRQRVGSRADVSYPAASLPAFGVTFSNGSDCPVEPSNVLAGIQCAVTRRPYTRNEAQPYLPQESLSIAEALRSFTAGGAYASFEESVKGVIREGYLADFTVLEQNPFIVPQEEIHSIPISAVYMDGIRRY